MKILTLLLLASVTLAQKPVTGLKGRQYIYCPCSPSTRGYRVDVLESVQEHIEEVADIVTEGRAERATEEEITVETVLKSQELWASCVNTYGMEECVNADTALRADQKCSPNCASFCEYDPGSWRNNANGAYGPRCDTVPKYRSKAVEINNSTTAEPGDVVPKTPANPRPAVEKPLSGKVPTRPKQANGLPAGGSSSVPVGKNEGVVQEPVVVPDTTSKTPVSVPTVTSTTTTTTDNGTSTNEVSDATSITATSQPESNDGGLSGVPLETLIATTNENTPLIGTPLNEGCVAVEHLDGYTLQHSKNLERTVLCANGFCATPNHALIVDKQWTSMSRMCKQKWDCVSTKKFVNNLKVAVNRRATFDDHIIITPYDIRFPRWCVWVVQIFEDVFHLVAIACVLGVITAFLVLVGCAVKEL